MILHQTRRWWLRAAGLLVAVPLTYGQGQSGAMKCAEMAKVQIPGVSLMITKAEQVPAAAAGTVRLSPVSPATLGVPLPSYCRVDGVIDQRTGVGGKTYGIGFAIALPDNWNNGFLFQGGGGLNGTVAMPLGAVAAGEMPGLARGFAVATTDSGHKGAVFDGSFFQDQQATLDFYYVAIGRVAVIAKDIVARYYGRAAERSYYVGCSTGGREAMIMSQRYPSYFDGIVSGDPAIRTGHSNLALAYAEAAYNKAAPKDENGKPAPSRVFSDSDKKLIVDSLLKACDAKDGLADGMIFNAKGCDFDPAVLACRGAKTDTCLTAQQVAAMKTAFGGPKDSHGNAVYPAFPYDAGIGDEARGAIPGLLYGPRSPVNPPSTATEYDAEQAEARLMADATARLGDATWTNLSTFSGHGGKILYYHGLSDPWFSPLDTVGYYEKMSKENGGMDRVEGWSRLYLVPGMGHCRGGKATLDQFDMLSALTDWVEKGKAPDSVVATGTDFPGRSRPLCAYPKHAQYTGKGDPNDARNFECSE
jgi:pimeloyl-ACP methyl ester carboxylesterase